MIRQIIKINESLCDGCSLCVSACHEGAIKLIDGKAKLIRDDYCDGLGNCLPVCPQNAIQMEEREAPEFVDPRISTSELKQWPVQIKLVPINAAYFDNCNLLIAADCTAFAYNNFHSEFMKDKVTLIACPKLDSVDYSEKLCEIFKVNDIKSVTVTRMEVPCCGGLEYAVKTAINNCGKDISLKIATISIKGNLI